MRNLLAKVRTRLGYATLGVLLAVAVGGVGTAAVIDSTPADEVSNVESVTTEPVETAAPTEPTDAVNPGTPVVDGDESPEAVPPARTVEDVTEPEAPAPVADPAPEPEPAPYDPTAPFTNEAGQTYLPGPDAPVQKLPSEPGYDSPTD